MKMKSLVTLGAVTHIYTLVFASKLIARDSKTFNVPKNIRNLNYNQNPPLVIV